VVRASSDATVAVAVVAVVAMPAMLANVRRRGHGVMLAICDVDLYCRIIRKHGDIGSNGHRLGRNTGSLVRIVASEAPTASSFLPFPHRRRRHKHFTQIRTVVCPARTSSVSQQGSLHIGMVVFTLGTASLSSWCHAYAGVRGMSTPVIN
jgi:hypothetical protein